MEHIRMQEVNVRKTNFKSYQLIVFSFSILILLLSPSFLVFKNQSNSYKSDSIISNTPSITDLSPSPTTKKMLSTPTCRPRPACLDSTPRCMIAETEDMCPPKGTPSHIPTSTESSYTCPKNGWVDCMPGPDKDNSMQCSKEAQNWYNMNCPDYQGVAY